MPKNKLTPQALIRMITVFIKPVFVKNWNSYFEH